MPKNEKPVSIRVTSEDGEGTTQDLWKLLYIFKPLKKLGKSRSAVNRNLNKIRKQRQYRSLDQRVRPQLESLPMIANENEVQLHFWDQSRHGKIPERIHSVIPCHEFPSVNIVAPYFNEPNEYDLTNLHLILDIEKFKRKITHQTQGNFWQCCEMSDLIGCEDWGQIAHEWGSDTVDLTREFNFIGKFGFGFNIFIVKNGNYETRVSFERIHKTRLPEDKKFINLEFAGDRWPEEKNTIELEDQFILRPKDFFRVFCCPFDYCDYNTTKKTNLDRHVKTCSSDTVIDYKQSILTNHTVRDWCIAKGAIPASFYPQHFASFDIESVGVPSDIVISEITRLHSLQRVVSVAVTSTFQDPADRTKVIVRDGMGEYEYRKFISEFVAYLKFLQSEFLKTLPVTLDKILDELKEDLAAFKRAERNYSLQQVNRIRQGCNYLEGLKRLHVFGFNSQSYDLSILFSGLLCFAKKHGIAFKVLKRGNQIMSLRLGSITFADCINFSPGVNLDSFGSMWGADVKKSVFPYEKYSCISGMAEDIQWPPMIDFKSSLRPCFFKYNETEISEIFIFTNDKMKIDRSVFLNMVKPDDSISEFSELANSNFPVCLKTYAEMWIYFSKSIEDGTMTSMLDYLKYYNSLDTEILTDGFKNYTNSFIKNFSLSPIGFISLPGLAERVMWSLYCQKDNKPYSFGNKFGFVNKIIRENLIGGLSCVFKRHVEINSKTEMYGQAVHRAKNGQPFSQLIAYDANSKFVILHLLPKF